MPTEQSHEMQLETVYPSGAEEWLCPECGRRFIAQWEPKFRRVILEQGQDKIIHFGHGMGLMDISVNSFSVEDLAGNPKLQDVWKKYLDQLDFDWKDNDDLGRSSE